MRVSARGKKELIISGILCVTFYIVFGVIIVKYVNFLNEETAAPKAYALQQVQGIETKLSPTASATATPTSVKISISPTITPTSTNSLHLTPTQAPTTDIQPPSIQEEILKALNNYRQKNGIGPLQTDPKLQTFSQSRADSFASAGSMDNHAGFQTLLDDNGFEQMGFNALGENSSYGNWEDAKNLIENIYGSSSSHNESQLKSEWTHVGIGVKGDATNLVFGGRKR